MGVYIKGFHLPEKSDMYYVKVECEAGKNPVATIWRKDLLGEMSFGAFEVVPVPPHGDLIDTRAVDLSDGPYEYQDWVEWAWEQYLNAPVFLPADPPKEKE